METAPLKAFGIWARTALIREVTARIAVVLAPVSIERLEQPNAVDALEKAVSLAGRSNKSNEVVADRVAYTWFNRIIALRFMDANGYTDTGVVSPQAGVEGGQPGILAEAKRGNIDAAVVGAKTRETVTALLNGTRRSDDAQGEAFALLLAEYCRYWNRTMPFMFERERDFTELLMPANLLADDSVLNRCVKVLTAEVCQDVEVIGWLYQFYISERKDAVFAGFQKNKKAGADEIPAATQLFTPHWIVRYLVENSLGRLWMLNRPSSHLVAKMEYYIAPVDEETDFLKVSGPEELRVIDPACGSGHMLTYAFDVLYSIYEEAGYAPAEIPSLILTNNLYGVEIDPRAGAFASFALTMKARAKQRTFFNMQVEPNVCVLEPIRFNPNEIDFLVTKSGDRDAEEAFWNQFADADSLGSLIQSDADCTSRLGRRLDTLDDARDILVANTLDRARRVLIQATYLSSLYSVVVANPPYMGSTNMAARLSDCARTQYPVSKSDLFAMFIERGLMLGAPRGLVAMVTMQSWMFLASCAKLRAQILADRSVVTMAHFGSRAFDSISGDVVATVGFVLCKPPAGSEHAEYVRLVEERGEVAKSVRLREAARSPDDPARFRVSCTQFSVIPGSPLAYWLPPELFACYEDGQLLSELLKTAIGFNTGDNSRFLRRWYEIAFDIEWDARSIAEAAASPRRWFPYNKGGQFRRWYGNHDFVIDWQSDGRAVKDYAVERNGGKHWSRYIQNLEWMLKPGLTWSFVGTSSFGIRVQPAGFLFDVGGSGAFPRTRGVSIEQFLALLCSPIALEFLRAQNPTMNFQASNVSGIPWIPPTNPGRIEANVVELLEIYARDWDGQETSWGFRGSPLVLGANSGALARRYEALRALWRSDVERAIALEKENNAILATTYAVANVVSITPNIEDITLFANPKHRYARALEVSEQEATLVADSIRELISYAVGCMLGRYSLDEPGLVIADQGGTLQDYLVKVPSPTFAPDADNVIPIVDGDWFEDDIVARFRQFLRAAFGERNFEDNLRFVTEALGVKDIRDYFVKSFYKDHVQRYKKRPIYWLFSSPKGSFNALIYMHRYTPSTASTVLNEYLREFRAKLASSLRQQERLVAGGGTPSQQATAQKEADRLRKVLLELEEYEHDVLYPLASRQLAIDLDDGVKANYPKFGAALKKIPGLEASDE